MSTSPETDELIQTEAAMSGGFYVPSAHELRQHLQLKLEERAARDQIVEALGALLSPHPYAIMDHRWPS